MAKPAAQKWVAMLVTVEGIDGSGKSSVCTALETAFPDATMTREPTGSWYGDAVRRSVNDPTADSLAELFLYTADHADHLADVVEPALADGRLVVSDRYSDSRYAYQGATLDDRFEDAVDFVQRIHAEWTRPPDLTLYVDVPAELGAERSGGTNKFERQAYLEIVRENYERLIAAEPGRFVRIDGTAPLEHVTDKAVTTVEEALAQ